MSYWSGIATWVNGRLTRIGKVDVTPKPEKEDNNTRKKSKKTDKENKNVIEQTRPRILLLLVLPRRKQPLLPPKLRVLRYHKHPATESLQNRTKTLNSSKQTLSPLRPMAQYPKRNPLIHQWRHPRIRQRRHPRVNPPIRQWRNPPPLR